MKVKMENIVQKITKPQTVLLVTNIKKNIVSKESLFNYMMLAWCQRHQDTKTALKLQIGGLVPSL